MSPGAPQGEILPWFWSAAPMPRPALWLLREGTLIPLPGDEAVPCCSAVLSAMREAAVVERSAPLFLAVRDSAGQLWRAKRQEISGGGQLWLAQDVERTRALLFAELRATLAAMLISPIRHELSGTVQTLSLSADIAARLLEDGRDDGRLADNLEVIRRRLLDLHRRQIAMLELWLSEPVRAHPPPVLKSVLEAAVGLLKGHLAIAGSRLLMNDLSALGDSILSGAAGYAGIGILALLLLLGPPAAQQPHPEKCRQTIVIGVAPGAPPVLELETSPRQRELPQFAGMQGATALAAIAVLLDAAGLELSPPHADDGVIRLRPQQVLAW